MFASITRRVCELVGKTELILKRFTDTACGVCSVATTTKRVKILDFKHFFKHFVFIEKSDFDIKKVQKNTLM